MAKKPVIFSQWIKAAAPSPYVGLGLVRAVDVVNFPGVVRINNLLSKVSASAFSSNILWIDIDARTGYAYAGQDDGKVFTNASGSWAQIAGNSGSAFGGAIWKDYLITKGTSGTLDAYGPLSSSPAWHNNWGGSISVAQSQAVYPMFASVDDKFYIGHDNKVDSFVELTTFDPTSAGTFTHNSNVITVGSSFTVNNFDDLGANLMVGKIPFGANFRGIAEISPFDRSTYTLQTPIKVLGESGVSQMKTVGNVVFFVCKSGRIYKTIGTTAIQVGRIPPYAISQINNLWPNAIDVVDGKLLFGVSTNGYANGGVWSYHLSYGTVQQENVISTGNDGSVNPLGLFAIKASSATNYFVGWQDNTTYGIDTQSGNGLLGNKYTSYTAFLETDLRPVGDPMNKASFEKLIIQLGKKLTTGQGVRISYRKNLTDSFTVHTTFDYATYSATQNTISIASPGNIDKAEFVQLKAELTTGSSSNTTPELKNVILI